VRFPKKKKNPSFNSFKVNLFSSQAVETFPGNGAEKKLHEKKSVMVVKDLGKTLNERFKRLEANLKQSGELVSVSIICCTLIQVRQGGHHY